MLLEILQGQTKQAAIIYEQIERLYQEGQPGAPYAEMAAAFWDEFVNSNSATSACKKAISFTLSHKDEILTSLGSGFHGLQNRIYEPKDICVIPEIH